MTKTNFFLFLTMIFISSKLFSQVSISGQIVNQNDKPVEFMEVYLQNIDSTNTKSELTTTDGKFTIITEKGEFLLLVKQLGIIFQKQNISLNQNLDLGIIQITENNKQLQEVIITSKNKVIENKVDRLVFNVENSSMAIGGDVLELLKVTPSLQVSDNEIAMIGKSSMRVMLNNRIIQLSDESLINYLKAIPSDNVSKVEVISTPPSKYESEGNSGLINIVLKKNPKDDLFNASIKSSYQHGIYGTGSVGGTIASQLKKWNLTSNINYTKGSYKATEKHSTYYTNQIWNQNNNRREFKNQFSGMLGIENQITKKSSFGFLYSNQLDSPFNNENDVININTNLNQPTNFYSNTNAKKYKKEDSQALNAHYKIELDSLGKFISFDADYFIFNQTTDRNFFTQSYINNTNSQISSTNTGNFKAKISTINLDSELPFKKIKILLGGKLSFIDNVSDFNYFDTTLGNQNNKFNYTENRQAFYTTVEKEINKWEFQFGLRLENTQTKGFSLNYNQLNTNEYLKLFPTAYILYKLKDNNVFSLNYSKRLGRPTFNMVDPFRIYQNQFSYTEGNPNIQPEFVNSFELSHTYKSNLNTKFSFLYLQDGKSQITIIDPVTNIQERIFKNFFDMKSYNLQLSYRFKKIKWLESYNSVNYNYKQTKVYESSYSPNISQSSFSYSMNNSFTLNSTKTFFADNSLFYQSPKNINVFQIKTVFYVNVGAKYLLLNKNLQLAINFSDVFKTNKHRSSRTSNNIYEYTNNYSDNQYFRFTALYKFGNKKIKANQHDKGNDEEINRTSN